MEAEHFTTIPREPQPILIRFKESHIFAIVVSERCKGFHALRIMG